MSEYIQREEIPGFVALVSRHHDLYVETFAALAFGSAAPMRCDTIFRIASITKPVVAVAAMILVEELADRRVLRSIASQLDEIASID